MPGPGRNQPCPCGSGRKTKRCCGQTTRPLRRPARPRSRRRARPRSDPRPRPPLRRALDHPLGGLMDLPTIDYSLHVTLPKLIGPDLQRLREAVEHDDPDWGWDALTAVDQADRHPTTTSPTRRRDPPTPRPTPHQPPPSRLRDLDLNTRSTTFIAASLTQPSPSRSAPAAPPAASTSPPNPNRLSGGSS